MKCEAIVTFESQTMPPKTYRGSVEANFVQTALKKAIQGAKKQYPGAVWSSIVVVLLKDAENRRVSTRKRHSDEESETVSAG